LDITAVRAGAALPAGASTTLNVSTPGVAIVNLTSPTDLPAGRTTLVHLSATVPSSGGLSTYGAREIIELRAVVLTDAVGGSLPAVADQAIHLASYFGDPSGNGRINASDAAQVARFAALLDTGFTASLLTDPRFIGDISGNSRVNAADASLVAQFAALLDVPEIPPIPAGIAGTAQFVLQGTSGTIERRNNADAKRHPPGRLRAAASNSAGDSTDNAPRQVMTVRSATLAEPMRTSHSWHQTWAEVDELIPRDGDSAVECLFISNDD
jgi:hypothetical protein